MAAAKIIPFDSGWSEIYTNGILKLQTILDEDGHGSFTNSQYSELYTMIYNMCIQKNENNHTQRLYDKLEESVRIYLSEKVLPAIQKQAGDEFFLRELVRRWTNHLVMIQWLERFFNYLVRPLLRS